MDRIRPHPGSLSSRSPATSTSAERVVAEHATQQKGVVTAEQLRAAGASESTIKRWLRGERLHQLRRGVYLVGHAAAPEGALEVAALLACGRRTVISHQSAGRLWGLPAFRRWDGPIVVTVVRRNPGRKPGIRLHRVSALDRRDVRRVQGIRVTSPARTLLDLASILSFDALERSHAYARTRGLVRTGELRAVIERNRGRRGTKALRRLFALDRDGGPLRSEAERKLLGLLHRAGLGSPERNVLVAGVEVDFVWRAQRVIVEVDGFAFHSDRDAFENDRVRDSRLVAGGYAVTRITWRELTARPEAVAARIAAALAVRSPDQS